MMYPSIYAHNQDNKTLELLEVQVALKCVGIFLEF